MFMMIVKKKKIADSIILKYIVLENIWFYFYMISNIITYVLCPSPKIKLLDNLIFCREQKVFGLFLYTLFTSYTVQLTLT